MSQLNSGDSPLRVDEADDPSQRLDVLVAPDAHVARRDSPLRRHGGCLNDNQRHTTDGPAAQMNQVPVRGEPVLSDVLTHGRHHDSVAESDAANRQRGKKIDLRDFPIMVSAGGTAVACGLGGKTVGSIRCGLRHQLISIDGMRSVVFRRPVVLTWLKALGNEQRVAARASKAVDFAQKVAFCPRRGALTVKVESLADAAGESPAFSGSVDALLIRHL